MEAGDLDRRIDLQRLDEDSRNEMNEPVISWSSIGKFWARRRDVSDAERLSAAQEGSALTSRFVVRSNSVTRTLTTLDRLEHDNRIWEIQGVKELDGGRYRFIEITASKENG